MNEQSYKWAEREIDILRDEKYFFGPGKERKLKSALRLYRNFCEFACTSDDTKAISWLFNNLVKGNPLTPIYDEPGNWDYIWESEGRKVYCCNRYMSLYKRENSDGSVEYFDLNRVHCEDSLSGVGYNSVLIRKYIDRKFPISFPYNPMTAKIRVITRDYLSDTEWWEYGRWDTKLIEAIFVNGERVPIEPIYFKLVNDELVQISFDEFKERKLKAKQLKRKGRKPNK